MLGRLTGASGAEEGAEKTMEPVECYSRRRLARTSQGDAWDGRIKPRGWVPGGRTLFISES